MLEDFKNVCWKCRSAYYVEIKFKNMKFQTIFMLLKIEKLYILKPVNDDDDDDAWKLWQEICLSYW